jgi:hypothetical protein
VDPLEAETRRRYDENIMTGRKQKRITGWYDGLYEGPLFKNTENAVAFLADPAGQTSKRILKIGIGAGWAATPLANVS